MDRVEVKAEVVVNPTEDQGKIEKALRAIMRVESIESSELGEKCLLLEAKASGLDTLLPLRALLRQDRVRDAARAMLFSGVDEKRIRFYVNKQVAYVGHISFMQPDDGTPLGPISVEISCDDPISVIDWIAPKGR